MSVSDGLIRLKGAVWDGRGEHTFRTSIVLLIWASRVDCRGEARGCGWESRMDGVNIGCLEVSLLLNGKRLLLRALEVKEGKD